MISTPSVRSTTVLVTPAPYGFYATLRRGMYGTPVQEMQQALKNQGYYYGAADGYSLFANIVGGWLIMALSLVSGFIVKHIVGIRAKSGYVEENVEWDSVEEK